MNTGSYGLNPALRRCLSLDLEISRDGGDLLAAAAYRPDSNKSLSISGRPKSNELQRLDWLAEDAQFLLGHNIIAFDIPRLRALNPHLRLLKLPVVDTLRLNPLAFPERPYHRLVKHYRDGGLVRRQINDPLLDSKLAVEAFANQLKKLEDVPPELLTAWHWLTTRENGTGFDRVFSVIRGAAKPTLDTCSATGCERRRPNAVWCVAGSPSEGPAQNPTGPGAPRRFRFCTADRGGAALPRSILGIGVNQARQGT